VGGDRRPRSSPVSCSCFNPRLRVGGDSALWLSQPAIRVSIRASAWEATVGRARVFPRARVSIRASAWEATWGCDAIGAVADVSIRASAWEATGALRLRDQRALVSIRASAWEATEIASNLYPAAQFQSAPPRGRRRRRRCRSPRRGCFNPRLRVGGDSRVRPGLRPRRVSIRASAWEATP